MGRKKATAPKIKAEAIAKAEFIAKATYQRKHSTTAVVPPDVTRAKAGAWLNLISPITEWAGLKGDALNFKRRLLRIQQEETLLRVAQEVQAKLAGENILHHVRRKILVPALEKASLEDVDDDVMIDRRANLLASAAIDVKVQPRFIGILEEMTGQQAECLERIAFNRYSEFNYPAPIFGDSFTDFAEYNIRDRFIPRIQKVLTSEKHVGAAFAEIEHVFRRPGVLLRFSTISDRAGNSWEGYDFVADTKIHDESDLSILESLGLTRYVALEFDVRRGQKMRPFEVSVYYQHLTSLGVKFCEVCSKPRVDELYLINETSLKKNLKYDDRY
jgi:hypothetical protein